MHGALCKYAHSPSLCLKLQVYCLYLILQFASPMASEPGDSDDCCVVCPRGCVYIWCAFFAICTVYMKILLWILLSVRVKCQTEHVQKCEFKFFSPLKNQNHILCLFSCLHYHWFRKTFCCTGVMWSWSMTYSLWLDHPEKQAAPNRDSSAYRRGGFMPCRMLTWELLVLHYCTW